MLRIYVRDCLGLGNSKFYHYNWFAEEYLSLLLNQCCCPTCWALPLRSSIQALLLLFNKKNWFISVLEDPWNNLLTRCKESVTSTFDCFKADIVDALENNCIAFARFEN